ncbi:zymogen granule membrane protein 16-like [Genypterus blacodes]|uniref:zymogen granule membrane protein 16-like n=1 Tax=Genypterus blacodes TaxID=154954 RepID=UPI003F76FD18
MHFLAVFAVLVAIPLAQSKYSYSPEVGYGGYGNSFSLVGEGRITAVRVWDYFGNIRGIQLRFGAIWASIPHSYHYGPSQTIELFEGEAIIQLSGRHSHYVNGLVFVTNRGRSLIVGQSHGRSFNMYAKDNSSELISLSGRYHGPLTSIGAHWGEVNAN